MTKKSSRIDLYHNPRCRKSREALHLLEEAGVAPNVILYLDQPPSVTEMKRLLAKLNMKPEELVRKEEALFKSNYKGKSMTDAEWIRILVEHPKLIQRPIAISGESAVIGRPPEQVLTLVG